MSYRTSTLPIHAASSENVAPLQISKENSNITTTPKQRKPLGCKNENTTPVSITPTHKSDPRVGHRPEKDTTKFSSIHLPERLHLSARTKKQQEHRKGLRDPKTPLKNKKTATTLVQDENAVASTSKSMSKSQHAAKHHKPQPSVKVPTPDGSFSIWIDEGKHATEKTKHEKGEEQKAAKHKSQPIGVDQENVLPNKEASPPVKQSASRTRIQSVQGYHTERTDKKKWTRKPLTEIDVHDLPEYRHLLRDGSPTPTSHNVSSSSLHSLSWSDGEAVLSQALEQAEATAQSILSDIKGKRDEPTQEDEKEQEDETKTHTRTTILSSAEDDVFSVVTKKTTKNMAPTTTKETKAIHKRRSDDTGSSEPIVNFEEDSIKKRLRPRRC
ncbi:hypothetical protein BGW37DRAFT_475853 [Umbelopsis sp. PMI_123]|nr:hypothetical protein BGW37DRAFT_475853 [Umbelopsis sp. PMI_123]